MNIPKAALVENPAPTPPCAKMTAPDNSGRNGYLQRGKTITPFNGAGQPIGALEHLSASPWRSGSTTATCNELVKPQKAPSRLGSTPWREPAARLESAPRYAALI